MTSSPSLSRQLPHDDQRACSTIAEVSREFNVSLRTLRFYEQQELLRPQRIGTQRLYSPRDRVRLKTILIGRRLGFSLREIGFLIRSHSANGEEAKDIFSLLDAPTVQRQIAELQQKKAELDSAIVELKAAMGSRRFDQA